MQGEQISRDNLPRSMRYAMTSVPAVEASASLGRFDASNGVSFQSDGANIIRLRVASDAFLQSSKHYLFFTLNTTGHSGQIDGDAGSVIERMSIESNGVLLEQIDRYAVWNGIKRNWASEDRDIMKASGESGGSVKKSELALADFAIAGAAPTKAETEAFYNGSKGLLQEVGLCNLGDDLTVAQSKDFCVALHSGFLKNTHEKALPADANFEIVLRLKANAGACIGVGGANNAYSISNPRLYCPIYRIENSDVMASYRSMVSQQGASWVGHTVKTYINSMPNTANKHIFQINDRSLSCLALITALRDNDADTSRLDYSNTATKVFFTGAGHVNQYVARINGQQYPESEITMSTDENGLNCGRAYEEAAKALAYNGEKYAHCNVSLDQFKSGVSAWTSVTDTGGITSGKGLICVDLKKFDDGELRMKGLNTAASSAPSTLEVNMSAAPGAVKDVTTFALIEAVYVMRPDGSMAVVQ